MTKEKAEQFIKEVTGRKIRWGNWDNKDYFIIPTGKWFDKTYKDPFYWKFEGVDQNNEKDRYYVFEGLSVDIYGNHWEYVEDFERYLEMLDLSDL